MSDRPPTFDDRMITIMEPDSLLPSQYFDRIRSGAGPLTGERRLLIAILEDAVNVYLQYAGSRNPVTQRLFVEAEEWIESEDRTWVFAFECVCDFLALDPAYLRRGLRARKAKGLAADAARAAADAAEGEPRRRASGE